LKLIVGVNDVVEKEIVHYLSVLQWLLIRCARKKTGVVLLLYFPTPKNSFFSLPIVWTGMCLFFIFWLLCVNKS
jgi:hypothetical protein